MTKMTESGKVPEVKIPTAEELRAPQETGKPMLLSSKWLVEAGLAMCDELLAMCKELVQELDKTNHDAVYLAMDVKSKTEWLQQMLQIAEEQEA